MKIVIEYVLIENFLINLMILKSVSLILKEKGRLFFLSAFLGACCTVVIPILYLSAIGSLLLQIGFVVWYVCISFKFKTLKKFMQIYLTYFVITLLYGGACFYIESFFFLFSSSFWYSAKICSCPCSFKILKSSFSVIIFINSFPNFVIHSFYA